MNKLGGSIFQVRKLWAAVFILPSSTLSFAVLPTPFSSSRLLVRPSSYDLLLRSGTKRAATFDSSSETTTMTETMSSKQEPYSYEPLCIGGDFAGLQAKFSPTKTNSNGGAALIPVPDQLVPESLLEWGQEPSSLEVIVSEDVIGGVLEQRQTVTVLPAVGCAIDNLDIMKSTESFSSNEQQTIVWNQPSDSVVSVDVIPATTSATAQVSPKKLRLETQFSLPNAHRLRLGLELQIQQQDNANANANTQSPFLYSIQSPMVLSLERHTNATSSHGTIADGGGLDGRTVSTLLGDWLRQSYSFAKQSTPTAIQQQTEWQSSECDPSSQSSRPNESILYLPNNVIISHGFLPPGDEWVLEIIHFDVTTATTSNDNEQLEGSSRRLVRRRFRGFDFSSDYVQGTMTCSK